MAKKKIECPECKREPLAQEPKLKGVIDVLRADVDALKNDVCMVGTTWRRSDGRPLGEAADFGYRPDLVALYNMFAAHPRAVHIVTAPFAARLYALIMEQKPKVIIDLGTGIGCSAAIASKAMLDAGIDGKVLTYDPRSEFVSVAREAIPVGLQTRMEFGVYSDDMLACVPWASADIVIVDGPINLGVVGRHMREGATIIIDRRTGGASLANDGHVLLWLAANPHWAWRAEVAISRFAEYTERKWCAKQNPDGSVVIDDKGNMSLVTVKSYGWPITLAQVRHKAK